ncbi:MAG: ZPR1 zinc finger domain-containing protein [Candidatus Heimdallarchaeaceae archaeon]
MPSDEIEFEELKIKCPVCGSENTKVTQKIMNLPYFPQLWFFSLKCLNCEFKHNDFVNLSIKEPMQYIYHATSKADYTTKIVRAANGTIRIPQIKATIEPGPNADSFINNIEGIIRDIQDKARFLLRDAQTDSKRRKIIEYISLLDEYIEKNLPLDVIVEDPFGNSSILPFDEKKLEVHKLTKEKADKLKTSFIVFEDKKEKE